MNQNIHLIEKYFRGELSEEELQIFNEKLQKDSDFEREFRDMKIIRDGVKESARMNALGILHKAEANLTEKETTKINVSIRRLVSIAASLIIIATVSYFAISDRTGGTMTGDEVFAAYYEAYPNIVAPIDRGEDMAVITLGARAYNAYEYKNYSESAELFAELLESEKNAANYFYSGISNLEAGNFDVAKTHFNTVMNDFVELREQSQWYLSMTLLKSGDDREATANLASIVLAGNNATKLSREAAKVLSVLGLKLEKNASSNTGSVDHTQAMPPEDGGMPSGLEEEVRRYQFGVITSLANNEKYEFFNDYPIEGLKAGDLVNFVLLKGAKEKNPMAIIIDAIQ